MFTVGMRIKRNSKEYKREFDTEQYQLSFIMNSLLEKFVGDISRVTETDIVIQTLSGRICKNTVITLPKRYVTQEFFIKEEI